MTNKSRDIFEAWLLTPPKRYTGTPSEWTEMQKEDDWEAWKAGRDAGLEEAARCAEDYPTYGEATAEEIRSLK